MATYYWYVAGNGNATWGTGTTGWYNGPGGTSGAATATPNATDNLIWNAASGSGTCTVNGARSCNSITMTGYTGNITGGGTSSISTYGSTVTLSANGVFDPGNYPTLIFTGGATTNFTTNGQSVGMIQIANNTSVVLQDNLSAHNNETLTLTYGTLNANGKDLSIAGLTDGGSTSTKKVIMGSGTWYLTGGGGLDAPWATWNISQPSSFTVQADTSTINFRRARDSTTLVTAITTTTQTTVIVHDITTGTAAVWPSTGTIQIDDELMTYSAVSSSAVNASIITLTISNRGVNGTSAATHTAGKIVFLVTPYVTALTSAIPDGVDTSAINVGDISSYPNDGWELVGGEVLEWTSKPTTTSLGTITRGTVYGGPASYHAAGSQLMHLEGRTFNGAGKTYYNIKFDTMGIYVLTDITGGFTATTVTNTNNVGIHFLNFDASAYTIANFNILGTNTQPVFIRGLSSSKGGYFVEYIDTTYPVVPQGLGAGNFLDLFY